MSDTLENIPIPANEWVDLYSLSGVAIGEILSIENVGVYDVRLSVSETQPSLISDSYNVSIRNNGVRLQNSKGDLGAWAYCHGDGKVNIRVIDSGFSPSLSANLHDGFGNPIESLNGAIDVHDADVHDIPINELFHRHTGINTTLASAIAPQDKVIDVVDGSLFSNGDPIQIENGIIETTFPTIISGGGTDTFTLDRPIDNVFDIGSPVEGVETNMAVDGSITPVAFRVIADGDQIWHIVRFLLAMVHGSAADDSSFGSIPALTNGCVLRGFNATSGLYRTFTNWKNNFDIKMDMFDVTYTDKAGAGLYGTNARGSVKIGTGAAPKINGANGDFLELLIQDDLTGLIGFQLKAQGHIEPT